MGARRGGCPYKHRVEQAPPLQKTWRTANHVKISSALLDWQGSPVCKRQCNAGRRAPTGPSSLCGNPLRTVRSCDDLPAGRRLLVHGIAKNPNAGGCGGMPVPELSACQDRSVAESCQEKRSV